MTKEEIIERVLEDQKIVRYRGIFRICMRDAMDEYKDQETAALRARLQEEEKEAETWQDSAIILEAKYNAMRTAIKDFCATIRIDNGNVYLPGFNEALEKLKLFI